MAYTQKNYRTKAELRRALIAGAQVRCYQPNGDLFGARTPEDGIVYLEGPHYPEPHRWHAAATLARIGVDVDAWPVPPAGLFVVEERTIYLRDKGRLTIAHEWGHALDVALGGGVYWSGYDSSVRAGVRVRGADLGRRARMAGRVAWLDARGGLGRRARGFLRGRPVRSGNRRAKPPPRLMVHTERKRAWQAARTKETT